MRVQKKYKKGSTGRTPWNKGLKGTCLKPRTGRNIICINCGKEKYFQLNELKKRERKYCSLDCYHKASRKEELCYSGLHSWIKREYGRATKCEKCGATKNIDWANISQKYLKDIGDWKQLCRKRHIAFDKKIRESKNAA